MTLRIGLHLRTITYSAFTYGHYRQGSKLPFLKRAFAPTYLST